jgi:hypothetical protein
MAYRFTRHYTREEARALLPMVRQWLKQLDHLRERLRESDEQLNALMESRSDAGGEPVENWVRLIADIRTLLLEFQNREIQVKDVERGLVDFPAVIGGKEVFLCWEKGEADVEFWHDLDAGYAGRERL